MLRRMQKSLSYILPEDEEEAKKLIEDTLGFPPPPMFGRNMAVKVWTRDEDVVVKNINGEEVRIIMPEVVYMNDVFRSCVALVLSQGSECYTGDKYKETGPWCKVGDFICFPRNMGTQIDYRGMPIQIIEDWCMYHPVEDPKEIHKYEE